MKIFFQITWTHGKRAIAIDRIKYVTEDKKKKCTFIMLDDGYEMATDEPYHDLMKRLTAPLNIKCKPL